MNAKEFTNLYWFCQSVEYGGFAAASQVVNASAPTLSRALTQIEERFGEKLVHRNAKQFQLTTAGEEYYQRFAPIFAQLDEQWLQLSNTQPSLTGNIQISCPEPFADFFLQELAIEFMAEHPKVNVIIRFASDTNRFIEDQIDLAIANTPPTAPNLVRRQLFNLELGLAASPDYLAKYGTPENVEALLERRLVAGNANPVWLFKQDGEQIKIPVKPHYFVNSLRLSIQAICAGVGIGLLPKNAMTALVDNQQLVPILDTVECPRGVAYMVWADRKLEPNRVTAFREAIFEKLGGHPDFIDNMGEDRVN